MSGEASGSPAGEEKAQGKACLEARDNAFFLEGKEMLLLSGAVHYFRIHPDYWEDRLRRVKAAGLNCVETYSPWNAHEPIPGKFDFEGILNVRRFIQLAHKLGLKVLYRPGPYICSEWEFGGLPSWLLRDKKMRVRSSYKPYLDAMDRYFDAILAQVVDLQWSRGGPIIAIQIENEHGCYNADMEYRRRIQQKYWDCGITELQFTSDNGAGIRRGFTPGVLFTINFQEMDQGELLFDYMRYKQPGMPRMAMEFWTGWFDHWSEKHHVTRPEDFEASLRWMLNAGCSVNQYMFHGGTTFGFMNGANEGMNATNEGTVAGYGADTTSYDYDAPVAENGDLTEKYHIVRKLIKEKCPDVTLDEPPANIPSFTYGERPVVAHIPFSDLIELIKPVVSDEALLMEDLPINENAGQSYGYTLYRTTTTTVKTIQVKGHVRDRALVYVNRVKLATLTLEEKDKVINVDKAHVKDGENVVDILVENLGRVSYGDESSGILNSQRKGIHGDVYIDSQKVAQWQIYPFDFKDEFVDRLSVCNKWIEGPSTESPSISRVNLNIDKPNTPQDTNINMKSWGKGAVFVNSFNIGRFWEIGPQQSLYIPGPLLKRGNNDVLVFDLEKPSKEVVFNEKAELGDVVIHEAVLPYWVTTLIAVLKQAIKLGPWIWIIGEKFA